MNNSFFLYEDVTPEVIKKLQIELLEFNKNKIEEDEYQEIFIFINSYGGDAVTALNFSAFLMNLPNKITTIVCSSCFSGAAAILLAGDERLAYKFSEVMFHDIKISLVEMKYGELNNFSTVLDALMEKYHNYISERTGISIDVVIDKLSNKEFYLTAEQALSFNIINKII